MQFGHGLWPVCRALAHPHVQLSFGQRSTNEWSRKRSTPSRATRYGRTLRFETLKTIALRCLVIELVLLVVAAGSAAWFALRVAPLRATLSWSPSPGAGEREAAGCWRGVVTHDAAHPAYGVELVLPELTGAEVRRGELATQAQVSGAVVSLTMLAPHESLHLVACTRRAPTTEDLERLALRSSAGDGTLVIDSLWKRYLGVLAQLAPYMLIGMLVVIPMMYGARFDMAPADE
jgi:hypothetical protein